MSTEIAKGLNLFQRINAVRGKIEYIKKDKAVSTGASGSYKAVTHDAVTAMTRNHMIEFGIVSFPILVESTMNPPAVDKDMNVSKQARYEATYDFVFVNCDAPEDRLTIRIQAHAMDNADKAPGKALSYAKKYAILKLFDIESGDDEESRYQDGLSDDRIGLLISNIKLADGDEKKAAYIAAMKECAAMKDVDAGNRIKAAVTPKEAAV